MAIEFERVFWIWINATSAAVITGDREIAGGQAHLAFGRCGDEIRRFLKETVIKQQGREWLIPLEPFDDLSAFDLPIYENSPDAQRAEECRLPSQAPTSRRSYGLWQRTVASLERDALPQQFILILRDTKTHFYARVLSATQMHLLPPKLSTLIFENRQSNQHFVALKGTFKDIASLPDKPKNRSQRVSRPKNNTTEQEKWRALARKTTQSQSRARARQVRQIEVNLRDRDTRKNALECFGERCQVQNCSCTQQLKASLISLTLEVHHLKAVAAKGDDSLFNLSVLCANHHSIFEKLKLKVLAESQSDDVILFEGDNIFLLERDLKQLRQALEDIKSEG